MISVLIVEDEQVAAEAITVYVQRVSGFAVGGHAPTGAEALRQLATGGFDLVLLDIYLPDMQGLDVVREMRARGHTTDVIVITRVRDLAVVQTAVSYGIGHYLVKPFTFGAFREKLKNYRAYRTELSGAEPVMTQSDIDHMVATLRSVSPIDLPKGISQKSLHAIATALRVDRDAAGESAGEIAARVGASRVTVRRFLEYLVDTGLASRRTRYGAAHRPELEYRWREPDPET